MPILILIFMILAHIIADWNLQGIMGQMKQRDWWIDQTKAVLSEGRAEGDMPDWVQSPIWKKVRHDYVMVLAIHGLEWSIIMHLPAIIYLWMTGDLTTVGQEAVITAVILIQAAVHAWLDNLKANTYQTNLIADQIWHLVQVFVSFNLLTYLI